MFKKTIGFLFGDIDTSKLNEICLILAFFTSLFSATCFFFDAHEFTLLGRHIHFPVGLLFFPATYVISNIMQAKYGKRFTNTVVACSFFADVALVSASWIIAHVGDRPDYLSVFRDLPTIMGATFIFLTVSQAVNIMTFEKLEYLRNKSLLGLFVGFFSSITLAELTVSSMSMPLLFYKQGFTTSVYLTILLTVSYKVIFNLVSTFLYVVISSNKKHKQVSNYTEIANSSV